MASSIDYNFKCIRLIKFFKNSCGHHSDKFFYFQNTFSTNCRSILFLNVLVQNLAYRPLVTDENFQVIVMSVAVTADVVHNIDDLDEATECALICTAFYLCVVRLLVYSFHQKDMLYVVNTMKEDWLSSSDQDRLIYAEKTMFAFRLAKYFITTVAITIVMFMSVPILEVNRIVSSFFLSFKIDEKKRIDK